MAYQRDYTRDGVELEGIKEKYMLLCMYVGSEGDEQNRVRGDWKMKITEK